jgi:hypothetical protein
VKPALYVSFALLLSIPVQAQNEKPVAVTASALSGKDLRIVANTKSQVPGLVFGQAACDETGHIYARTHDHSEGNAQLYSPVRKIAEDGTILHSFAAPPGLAINGFFVRSDGEVYLLAWATEPSHPGSRAYIVEFSTDGSLKSSVQIQAEGDFLPAHIAVFPSGEILLSGRRGENSTSPFNGIFTSGGKLMKKISQPEDDELRKRAEARDPDVSSTGTGNDAVDLGTATVGSDGNVYLLRSTSPALISVISAGVEVVRKLQVGTDDAFAYPVQLLPFRDGLALLFAHREGGRTLEVISLQGNRTATYRLDNLWLGTLGCYTPQTFTFITAPPDEIVGAMYLTRVQPK